MDFDTEVDRLLALRAIEDERNFGRTPAAESKMPAIGTFGVGPDRLGPPPRHPPPARRLNRAAKPAAEEPKVAELSSKKRKIDRSKQYWPPRVPSALDLAIARALQRPPRGTNIPEAESKLRATATAVRGRYNPQADEAFQRAVTAYREDGAGEEHF